MNATDYQTDALERLAKCNGAIRIRLSDTKPAPWASDESGYRPHYRVTLRGPGGSYTFNYWASLNDGETGRTATPYDVLACLEWHTPPSFDEFCADFGESTDSRRAYRTWRACLAMTTALRRIFPSESARDCLAEVR